MSFVTTEAFQTLTERAYDYLVQYHILTPCRLFYSNTVGNEDTFVCHVSLTVGGVPVVASYDMGGFVPGMDGWNPAMLLKLGLHQRLYEVCLAGDGAMSMDPSENDPDYVPSLDFPFLTEITREVEGVEFVYTHTPINY